MVEGMQSVTATTPESRARIAYTAYGQKVGFKAFNGDELPRFHEMPENIRNAWIAATNVIWDLATTGHAKL